MGLAAFWVPVFARKGGRAHVRAGRVYAYSAYVVTLSAVTASAWRIGSYAQQGVGLAERPDLYSHLGSMLGGGIAFHPAFAVFGVQRLISYELPGPLTIVPWLLPTIIGVPAIVLWGRHYKRRFSRG